MSFCVLHYAQVAVTRLHPTKEKGGAGMQVDMQMDERQLLSLVRDTNTARRTAGKFPYFTVSIEARKVLGWSQERIDRTAEALRQSGAIRIGRTRNDYYYELSNNN